MYNSGNLFKCVAVKFFVPVSKFVVDGCKLPFKSVWVSYDRIGNVLIGMDIMRHFDCHEGDSLINSGNVAVGDYIRIMGMKNYVSKDYVSALYRYFGILPSTDRMLELIDKGVFSKNDDLVKSEYIF